MRGILLAGGSATRLSPATGVISKQMVCVYDKPMIYYPLSTMIRAGVKDIVVISTPAHTDMLRRMLGGGIDFGCNFSYAVQEKPGGIAQAFSVAEPHIDTNDSVMLVLGDNILFGYNIGGILKMYGQHVDTLGKASIFAYRVASPSRYGVVSFKSESDSEVRRIVEKPSRPESCYAVIGTYIYPSDVYELARDVKPSKRGELEITDINTAYLEQGRLMCKILPEDGYAWFDGGTPQSLMRASEFVESFQERTGVPIGSIEKAAYDSGAITQEAFEFLVSEMPDNTYRELVGSSTANYGIPKRRLPRSEE